ncbi:ATP-binding protein [Propionivibrio sp.]|uniref:PAS domain-containing hybrid sensor histidine kinase/response regulator n=1 Tax=Propionivibrio sp. TaxID=2212460 RepID=UPI003BEFC8F9
MNPSGQLNNDAQLRTAAEAQSANAPLAESLAPPASDLLHELHVHQIELEMQNESLRQSQIALEESRDRYVDLYEFAPVGYLTLTLSGRISEINLNGATLLGRERKKLLHISFTSLVVHEDQDRWTRHFLNEAQGKTELALQRGDGSVFHAQLDWQRTSGNAPGVRIALSDITARKLAEAELIAAKQAAENASLAKSRFLASASHDLRQPIQAINLFNDALGRTKLSEDQKKISDYLSLSVRTLGDLLNVLLDISKLDAGMVQPFPEEILSEAIFARIEAEFSALVTKKGLRLMLYYPARGMRLLTDPVLLQNLLRNLIDNAIKYTEQGGILVGIRRRGKRALIQVWDTGIGIAPEHLADIFEEYFQVGNPARDRVQGLGLGLSIVRRLAKLLNAQVSCRSRLGRGTVFEISLPLVEEVEALANHERYRILPTSENDEVSHGFAGRSVVVIEDDFIVAQALEFALASLGMSVMTFGHAEAALSSSEIALADFYISDFRLPGMNGMQLLDAIQQRSSKPIKAVLLTGDGSPDRIQLTQSSRWTVLFKPVDLPKLLSALAAQDHERCEPCER